MSVTIHETDEELANCTDDVPFFDFSNETHKIKVTKCYDGDTLYCIFKHDGRYQQFKIRMYGYNSAEMRQSTKLSDEEREANKARAIAAKERLESLVMDKYVYLRCDEMDKYGRILGTVYVELDDDKSVNDMMVEEGYGEPYFGGTK